LIERKQSSQFCLSEIALVVLLLTRSGGAEGIIAVRLCASEAFGGPHLMLLAAITACAFATGPH
jgi:hypothetical protein